jgi:hypothetical protein
VSKVSKVSECVASLLCASDSSKVSKVSKVSECVASLLCASDSSNVSKVSKVSECVASLLCASDSSNVSKVSKVSECVASLLCASDSPTKSLSFFDQKNDFHAKIKVKKNDGLQTVRQQNLKSQTRLTKKNSSDRKKILKRQYPVCFLRCQYL